MNYKALQQTILNDTNQGAVELHTEGGAYSQIDFKVPIYQSVYFGGQFLPLQDTYRIYVKGEYEDYLDMFSMDDWVDEDAEDKYYEFLDEHEEKCQSPETAFSILKEWAETLKSQTSYIDPEVVELFNKCRHL